MSYRIITHNGKAHMDELLAVSLLAVYRNEMPETVLRINSQDAADLLEAGNYEENTYFIDTGLAYNPEQLLFDHHQDLNLPCSALQVFEYYFPLLKDSRLHKYIKLVSAVDTKGVQALPDFDTSAESRKYFSFSQNLLLKTFEENPLSITEIFKNGLEEKIDFERKCRAASEWLSEKGNVEIAEQDGIKILVYNNRPPMELFQATRSEDKDIVDEYEADAVYSFDEDDSQKRTLFRTNHGYKKLDFSRAEVSETIFCHKGGFLLKFRPSSENEWIDIIGESMLSFQTC